MTNIDQALCLSWTYVKCTLSLKCLTFVALCFISLSYVTLVGMQINNSRFMYEEFRIQRQLLPLDRHSEFECSCNNPNSHTDNVPQINSYNMESNDTTTSTVATVTTARPSTTTHKPSPTTWTSLPHYLLVVAVMSHYRERRDAIRETWQKAHYYKDFSYNVPVKFVIGTRGLNKTVLKALEAEEAKHQDIVFLPDHKENYANQTGKVLSSLVWVDQHMNYSYMMKCDDDSFILLDKIAHELHARKKAKGLYWGYFFRDVKPLTKGKWAEHEWTLSQSYPLYASGGGYVLSRSIVNAIVMNIPNLKLYANSDVSIGLWTAPFDIERYHDVRFDSTGNRIPGCRNTTLLSIIHRPTQSSLIRNIQARHRLVKYKGKMCR